ncbi:MAG: glycosyl transferase [Candidatus Rokuibacteriota bacterium]|nr:MAG: glycosyl transferase [Candidatus Rokubacteria bacterium]
MILKLAILESMSFFAAVCGAILIRTTPSMTNWTDVAILLTKALAISLCCTVSFYYNDLYDLRVVRTFGEFAARLCHVFGIAFILLAALYTVFREVRISSEPFLVAVPIILGILLPLRAILYVVVRKTPFLERVLILGTTPLARTLIKEITTQPHLGYTIVGVVDGVPVPADSPLADLSCGPLERLGKILAELQPNRVIVALAERRARLPVRELLEARVRGCIVEDGVNVYERLTGKLAIEAVTPSNLIFSGDFRKSRLDLAAGRAISLLVSVVGMVVLSPLLGIIALLIKLDSSGPVFFVQERVGMAAKRFKLIKFRTMHRADAPTSEWVCDNAERITRVGKWLRKFRLDELPQFFNIIRGDMNLVGPRPHPVSNFELFIANIPYYSLRAVVRPGITGWAQVRYGYANNLDEETEKMRYDLYYIKHLAVSFDIRILFDTVKTVLFGSQSVEADQHRVVLLPGKVSTGHPLEVAK